MSAGTKKKTAPGRISGGGLADPKTSGCARAKDYTTAESEASVCDGQRLLGFLVDEPRQVAALTSDRMLIGLFPDRRAATRAIQTHHQTARRAA
ncbi:hypothetical protein OZ411_01215 [Bradyrhizobium sp. Arg237L]|uniref:hypothetical protein n=1 Tax=Bradyrhizobium sp. Arg237L TaxID=3003352 RepID=UPI00249EDE12|nr:hypothetical protein [Bradyrhizobium sp. Arg237L]MDI4231432.1 hypothetical protein [Bradyrhizobium sp. Arg237L]